MVDYYRAPPYKDHTGWRGPAKICSLYDSDSGIIFVRYQGRVLSCRPQDLRPHVVAFVFLAEAKEPLKMLRQFCEGTSVYLLNLHLVVPTSIDSKSETSAGWRLSQHCKQHKELYHAVLTIGNLELALGNCVGARLSRGHAVLSAIKHFFVSYICW